MKKRVASRKRKTAATRRRARTARTPSVRWHEAVVVDYHRLIALPHVEGVALGWKERAGKVTARMAVKIYVTEKKQTLAEEEQLPKTTPVLVSVGRGVFRRRRIPTDVVWHAPATFVATPGEFLDPAPSGAMIGIPGHQFGTYACLAANATGHMFALTAGHVVQTFQGKVIPGIQILQPPVPAPGIPPGASLLFGRTVGGLFGLTPDGFLDVAVLQLLGERAATTDALDGFHVQHQVMPSSVVVNNRIPCTKFGAATGRTFGIFATKVLSMVINGVAVTDVLEFKGLPGHLFAAAGDSGALVVSNVPDGPALIIGLLFAATPPSPDAPAGRGFVVPFDRIEGLRPL